MMANTIGIQNIKIDNVSYSIKAGTVSYTVSGSEKTAIVNYDGTTSNFTEEKKAGMIKLDVTLKNAKDINTLRNLDNKNIIIELVNDITVLGSNMVQIASSEVNINDGVESFEFHGNVRIK